MLDLSEEEREVAGAISGAPEPRFEPPVRQVREAKRDRAIAHLAVLMMDTVRMIEPVCAMLSGLLLRWAALGTSFALAMIVLRIGNLTSQEKVAVLVGYMVLIPWVLRGKK